MNKVRTEKNMFDLAKERRSLEDFLLKEYPEYAS